MHNVPRVTQYRAAWHHSHRRGSVVLVTVTNLARHEQVLENMMPEEWMAVVDLLRNERPHFWDPTAQTLYTMNELVGEVEID